MVRIDVEYFFSEDVDFENWNESGAAFLPYAAEADVVQPPVPGDSSGSERSSGEFASAARLAAPGSGDCHQTSSARGPFIGHIDVLLLLYLLRRRLRSQTATT